MSPGRVILIGTAILLCWLVAGEDAPAPIVPRAAGALPVVRQITPETHPGLPVRTVLRWSAAQALPGGPTLRLQPEAARLMLPLWSRRDYTLLPPVTAPAGAGRSVYVRYLARDPSLT